MAGPMALLREIHRHKVHAKDLSDQIDRGPRTLRAHQDKVAKAEQAQQEANDAVKRLKLTISEKELMLKTKQGLIEKYTNQLNSASSPKEYQALKQEIVNERTSITKIEDEILEHMSEADVRLTRLPDFQKEVDAVKTVTNRLKDDIQTRRNELTDQLNEVHKKIKELEVQLPIEAKEKFDRLTTAKGEDALSALNGKTCTACYTEITAEMYNNLLQERFVLCKVCDRILYIPE
ncbi:MAG: zinc ribbon domain-containing protein [Gemmataceae bacterium]